jgi:hypothetical protein
MFVRPKPLAFPPIPIGPHLGFFALQMHGDEFRQQFPLPPIPLKRMLRIGA